MARLYNIGFEEFDNTYGQSQLRLGRNGGTSYSNNVSSPISAYINNPTCGLSFYINLINFYGYPYYVNQADITHVTLDGWSACVHYDLTGPNSNIYIKYQGSVVATSSNFALPTYGSWIGVKFTATPSGATFKFGSTTLTYNTTVSTPYSYLYLSSVGNTSDNYQPFAIIPPAIDDVVINNGSGSTDNLTPPFCTIVSGKLTQSSLSQWGFSGPRGLKLTSPYSTQLSILDNGTSVKLFSPRFGGGIQVYDSNFNELGFIGLQTTRSIRGYDFMFINAGRIFATSTSQILESWSAVEGSSDRIVYTNNKTNDSKMFAVLGSNVAFLMEGGYLVICNITTGLNVAIVYGPSGTYNGFPGAILTTYGANFVIIIGNKIFTYSPASGAELSNVTIGFTLNNNSGSSPHSSDNIINNVVYALADINRIIKIDLSTNTAVDTGIAPNLNYGYNFKVINANTAFTSDARIVNLTTGATILSIVPGATTNGYFPHIQTSKGYVFYDSNINNTLVFSTYNSSGTLLNTIPFSVSGSIFKVDSVGNVHALSGTYYSKAKLSATNGLQPIYADNVNQAISAIGPNSGKISGNKNVVSKSSFSISASIPTTALRVGGINVTAKNALKNCDSVSFVKMGFIMDGSSGYLGTPVATDKITAVDINLQILVNPNTGAKLSTSDLSLINISVEASGS